MSSDVLIDLASRSFGGSVVYVDDDLFADRSNLIMDDPVRDIPEFGPRGKVYDGWETRRRRSQVTLGARPEEADHDDAIVRLGAAGVIERVVVDTTFFRGNFPPFVSLAATSLEGYPSLAELMAAPWETLIAKSAAHGDQENLYPVEDSRRWTHVRLSIHPDGGVARLRVHGRVVPDPRQLFGTIDLAALENGGAVEDCSNMFYASPSNALRPGLAANTGDGWETARRRDDGNDWVEVRLVAAGTPREIEIDTTHFIGNAPAAATVSLRTGDGPWRPVLQRIRLQPDTRHRFPLVDAGAADRLRVDLFPDGGLARLRLRGELSPEGLADVRARWWNALPAWHRELLGDANAGPSFT